jgi:hypothetical protein
MREIPTLADWLRSAEDEYHVKTLAARWLDLSDRDFVQCLSAFTPEQCRLALKEFRQCKDALEARVAGIELLDRVIARLSIAVERAHGSVE